MARFFRRGKSKIYFLPAVANQVSPTTAEINAGTDLSPQIQAMSGFQLTNAPIATPDLATRFTKSIPGEDTTATSSLTFWDNDDPTSLSQTIRTVLAKDTIGYIFLVPYGRVTGRRGEIWNVQTTGVNDEWTIGNDGARFLVQFSILDVPVQTAINP